MVDTAFNEIYVQNWMQQYERTTTALMDTVTTEANINGRLAVFLTVGSSREAVTRGSNGLIPSGVSVQTQHECLLEEWHDKEVKTTFDEQRGQANQIAIMAAQSVNVISRKKDDQIIDQLNTATVAANSSAGIMTRRLFSTALATLRTNNVPNGEITAVLTPAAFEYLMELPQFASVDYVNSKPYVDGQKVRMWNNVRIMEHTGLPGVGTNAAKCFFYHKGAIGHASAPKSNAAYFGFDEQNDYWFTRHSIYSGAKLLQNSGVVIVNHDDSALIGS